MKIEFNKKTIDIINKICDSENIEITLDIIDELEELLLSDDIEAMNVDKSMVLANLNGLHRLKKNFISLKEAVAS
jgi:hypothetical protein